MNARTNALHALAARKMQHLDGAAPCACLARLKSKTSDDDAALVPHDVHWSTLDALARNGLAETCNCTITGDATTYRLTSAGLASLEFWSGGAAHPLRMYATGTFAELGVVRRASDIKRGACWIFANRRRPALVVDNPWSPTGAMHSVQWKDCNPLDLDRASCVELVEDVLTDSSGVPCDGVGFADPQAEAHAWWIFARCNAKADVTPALLGRWLAAYPGELELVLVRELAAGGATHELALMTEHPVAVVATYAGEHLAGLTRPARGVADALSHALILARRRVRAERFAGRTAFDYDEPGIAPGPLALARWYARAAGVTLAINRDCFELKLADTSSAEPVVAVAPLHTATGLDIGVAPADRLVWRPFETPAPWAQGPLLWSRYSVSDAVRLIADRLGLDLGEASDVAGRGDELVANPQTALDLH
jgi:hypothetical protein